MPISPKHYLERAAALEQLAATITDQALKAAYLQVVGELRRLAGGQSIAEQSDEQIEQLAERMIGNPIIKL
jgi:hypothetical protein